MSKSHKSVTSSKYAHWWVVCLPRGSVVTICSCIVTDSHFLHCILFNTSYKGYYCCFSVQPLHVLPFSVFSCEKNNVTLLHLLIYITEVPSALFFMVTALNVLFK